MPFSNHSFQPSFPPTLRHSSKSEENSKIGSRPAHRNRDPSGMDAFRIHLRAMAMWIFPKASMIILHEMNLQSLERLRASEDESVIAQGIITECCAAVFEAVSYMTGDTGQKRRIPTQSSPHAREPWSEKHRWLLSSLAIARGFGLSLYYQSSERRGETGVGENWGRDGLKVCF